MTDFNEDEEVALWLTTMAMRTWSGDKLPSGYRACQTFVTEKDCAEAYAFPSTLRKGMAVMARHGYEHRVSVLDIHLDRIIALLRERGDEFAQWSSFETEDHTHFVFRDAKDAVTFKLLLP